MNGIHRKAFALSAAALVLAGAAWILWRAPQATDAGVANPQPVQTTEPAAGTAVDASPPGLPPAPLPPANAPIDAIAATLQQRADAGDARAACRLAAELIRCRQDAAYLAAVADPESPMSDRLALAGKLDEAISLDERMLAMSEQQQHCRALPAGLLDRAGDYLAQAARAGEPEAMILYLEGQHFPQAGMGLLSDPGFEAWRRDTPAMAQSLLRGGHPEAVFILALAYGDDETWFGGIVPDDAVLNEAYTQLLRRLTGSAGQGRPSGLDAADQARALTLAEEWHARHFDNRHFRKEDITQRLNLMAHRRPESSPAPCDP